ncbi:flagellar basal body rod modification protein [Photobacterium gaetbulicola]|uniref:Basal-body rod modification protein FlgD n=1 Tax=Photobacterium gaetbulicola Gung47 TaxID=658445 RepID=A0A0C5WXL0_9GAMM|nr:flagellar hook capping FlgD N-terminal domain-containing protein [Photobacterium gaetbulicola]AJR07795.1 putative flagellar basal body rod modification protein [Photobacterium gaetbulicola Gung47]PSU03409.1 flagellar basal body rod modification protein [Photobacterium gaetbulicola]
MSTPYVTSSSGTTTTGQDPIASNGQQDNTFLTLMIAQIQNQTPLDPLDTTQFMTQMAQMTQVETMQNMNGTVLNQMVLLDNIQVLTTAGMVGQDVRVTTDSLELAGKPLDAVIELDSTVDDLKVEIRNDAGELVHTIELGANSDGEVAFVIDPKAMGLKDGQYDLTVVTNDSDYKPDVMVAGKIEKMRIPPGGGSPEFLIAGVGYVPFYNVNQYGESQGSASQSPEPTPLFTLAGRR